MKLRSVNFLLHEYTTALGLEFKVCIITNIGN